MWYDLLCDFSLCPHRINRDSSPLDVDKGKQLLDGIHLIAFLRDKDLIQRGVYPGKVSRHRVTIRIRFHLFHASHRLPVDADMLSDRTVYLYESGLKCIVERGRQ